MISALTSGSIYTLIESYYGVSDSDGKFSKLISPGADDFDLKIWVKNNNDVIVSDRFDGVSSSDTLNIIMFPNDIRIVDSFDVPEEPQNSTNSTDETANTTLTGSENQAEATPGITGLAASDDTGGEFSTKYIPYFVAVFLILGLGVFFFMVKRKRMSEGIGKPSKEVKVVKLSDIKSGKAADLYKRTIEDAEKKIIEAQREIKRLKNTERIDEIKHRMIEDQKELMKLRGDED